MVRLKANRGYNAKCTYDEFQFHYGTIKSFGSRRRMAVPAAFQFHYGTIKRTRLDELH